MAYKSLWGAADTPFMVPNQVLLSTPSTTAPLKIMAKANSATPYYTRDFGPQTTIPANVLSIGAFDNALFPYYSTINTPVPVPAPRGNRALLPIGIEASVNRPYFTK